MYQFHSDYPSCMQNIVMTAKALALEVVEKIVWIEFRIIDEECGEYFMNGETGDGSLLISPLSLFTV